MSNQKTLPNDRNVRAYLAGVEPAGRREDAFVLLEMMERVTGHTAQMWGDRIVGFGQYDYTYASGRSGTWMRTGFGPGKAKMSVYLMAGFDGQADALSRLGKAKHSVSCLYLPRLSNIDMDVLEEMVRIDWAEMARRYPL